jgi:hypothetical protein
MASALLPPPYEELSPDGRRYFKLLGVSSHLIRMYELLLEASDLAAVRPGAGGKAQALQIDLLIAEVRTEVEAAARRTASFADDAIRSQIEQTRVRPPTIGVKNSHSSLLGGVLSRPVESILPGGGAVGIADIEELIHATLAPSTNSQTPYYWRAQEFGSDHLVRPEPSQFRRHPVFEVRGKGEGKSHKMVVRNPIEERGFLRKGGYEAYTFRRGLHRATESRAVARMREIATGTGRVR